MRKSLLAVMALVAVSVANAEFKWEASKGWTSTEGVLEERLKQGVENPDALHLMNQAADLNQKGKKEKARTAYREVAHKYSTSLLAPEANVQMAAIRMEQGEIDKAFACYGEVVAKYPAYPSFEKVLKEMFSIADRLGKEKTTKALGIWAYKDREAAIDAFEKIVTAAPYSDYAPRALDIIAKLYKEKDEELSAVDAYQRLISSYPNHPLAQEAYLAIADTYRGQVAGAPYDQGATTQAAHYYEEFITLYPENKRVEEAKGKLNQMREILAQSKYNLAVFYIEKRNNPNAAANMLKEAIQTAPESQTAIKAQKLLEKLDQPAATKKSASSKAMDILTFWKKKPAQTK